MFIQSLCMYIGYGANVLHYLSAGCIARFLIILPKCQLYQIIMLSLLYVAPFVFGHDDIPVEKQAGRG